VLPEVGKQYAAMLRANLAEGKYGSFPDADAFAQAVTADLQAVHKDGHLKLLAPKPDAAGGRRPAGELGTASGIVKSGWIAPGVAYISFRMFPENEATLKELRAFLETHKSAKTLIIDARGHRGGGIAEMGLMFPYLFAKSTVLLDMDTREAVAAGNEPSPEERAYVRDVKAPPGIVRQQHFVEPAADGGALQQAKIFVLTSKRTASAAEHLSLALKLTHRATLIGESTYGAGNYGSFVQLGSGYSAFVPFGRTFDPDTDQGWEGTGVAPDVAVPADKALDEALRRAGVSSTSEMALANMR